MLAFVHIEKTAGTTLNQILRRSFLLRFIDVRPLSSRSHGTFTAEDLRKYLFINPWLEAVSGHSIRPILELSGARPEIRYITLLRNPIRRYISQFLYFVRIRERSDDFARFLDQEEFANFQTKKLAGCEDLCAAISALDQMFAVGVAEEFDALLLRLKKALLPLHFDIRYASKNVGIGMSERVAQIQELYGAEIRSRNEKDLLLYHHAINRVIPRHNEAYGSRLMPDLESFRRENRNFRAGVRDYIDYAARKSYYQPVSGAMRRLNGLSARGSY
ncbi:MAG: hypothetical protein ACREVI_02705 [Steroidobacteraceae bacterium]